MTPAKGGSEMGSRVVIMISPPLATAQAGRMAWRFDAGS
jgi:hypothetical protein